MTVPFIDTDPIVRMVTGDDVQKQQAARRLFEQVESGLLELAAPVTVIADAVYVLTSNHLYRMPRAEARDALLVLLHLPGFHVSQKATLIRALDIFTETRLDFSDAVIVSAMSQAGSQTLYTHDRHFDRVPGVRRLEPGQPDVQTNGRVE